MVTLTVHVAIGATGAEQPDALKSTESLKRNPVTFNVEVPIFVNVADPDPVDPRAGEPVLAHPLALTKCRFRAVPSARYALSALSRATLVGSVTVAPITVSVLGDSAPLTYGTRFVPPLDEMYTAPDRSTASPVVLLNVVSSVDRVPFGWTSMRFEPSAT
jgi:hypothetical protein